VNRELIYQALFAKLSAVPGLVTVSRRLAHWVDVPADQQPALYQSQKNNVYTPKKGFPGKVTFYCDIYLYTNSGNDPNATPSIQMNTLMDAIDAALAPDPATGVQTLGETVSHCWIEGDVITDEGTLGPQAVSIIPVNILVNH
jgi:hypothetical protein